MLEEGKDHRAQCGLFSGWFCPEEDGNDLDPVAVTASGDAYQQVESHSLSALILAEPRREFGPHSVRGRGSPDTG